MKIVSKCNFGDTRAVVLAATLTLVAWSTHAFEMFVDVNGLAPEPPYAAWESAATSIQDAVDVAPSGTVIRIAGGHLPEHVFIDEHLTLVGAGPAETIVDGGGRGRVFVIGSNAVVTLADLMIQGGKASDGEETWDGVPDYGQAHGAPGGGVVSWGDLVMSNCVVQGNIAGHGGAGMYAGHGGDGGGIASLLGSLTLADCVLSNNAAGSGAGIGGQMSDGNGGHGGGLFAHMVTIERTVFTHNAAGSAPGGAEWVMAGDGGSGGGARIKGGIISDSLFEGNSTGHGSYEYDHDTGEAGGGGGLYSAGGVVILRTRFIENWTASGRGGDHWVPARDGGSGAGLLASDGTVSLCVFSNNVTGRGSSGSAEPGGQVWGGNGGTGGGAMLPQGEVRSSLFVDNRTGDGGTAFADEEGAVGYGGSGGNGAGLWSGGSVLVNLTMVGGQIGAGGEGDEPGGQGQGGGVWAQGGLIKNSILWGNDVPTLAGTDFTVAFSLVEGGSTEEWFDVATSLDELPLFVDFALRDLRLEHTSPAIDAGDNEDWMLVAQDLDGYARILDEVVDMGAYESIRHLDSDGDGMPDWWEIKYGFDPYDPKDAGVDSDGSGMTNLEEYRAGTNPQDANSYLGITDITRDGEGVRIDWQGGTDALQRIQTFAPQNGSEDTWITIKTLAPPTPVTNMLQINALHTNEPPPLLFFRIQAER